MRLSKTVESRVILWEVWDVGNDAEGKTVRQTFILMLY